MLICEIIYSVPVVLVGNKTDLHQERAVSYEEGKKLAESWRASFLETSAKQNEVSGQFIQLDTQWKLLIQFDFEMVLISV